MASITTWMRLEPHSRSADMETSLEMRIHDPLWMLARQWQFGEFQGEDAGSPVWASYLGDRMPLALFLPGQIAGHSSGDVQEYPPEVSPECATERERAFVPLEYLIERERTPAFEVMTVNRRTAVEAGQQLLRLLGQTLKADSRAALIKRYEMKELTAEEKKHVDADSLAFLDLVAGRALDGAQVVSEVQGKSPEAAAFALGLDGGDQKVVAAIKDWLCWCDCTIGPASTQTKKRRTWTPERMEYSCALAAPQISPDDQIVLSAQEYLGGHLDWYSFDVSAVKSLERKTAVKSELFCGATLPTSLSFRGLPANRLWEFEDAQVRFGSIQAAPTDLARMLLVEFLIEYGNDFFTIPIELNAGSLFKIKDLTIINTFGDVTHPMPFADDAWRMFALSGEQASQPMTSTSMLFLPPVLGQHLASPPFEDVHLLRDEMANLAWAVEHIVESGCGRPLIRHEAFQARRERETKEKNEAPVAEGALVYQLDTWDSTLPDYWIPLVPVKPEPGSSPLMLQCYDRVSPSNPRHRSRGRLLSEPYPVALYLFDEEVPRVGAHVTRAQQYTRWYGGTTFAWVGREKRPGRGEGSSGLRYDTVEVGQ